MKQMFRDEIIFSQAWPDLTDKKVLIAGGSGFIGIHMTDFFSSLNSDVTSIYHTEPTAEFWRMMPVVDMHYMDLTKDIIPENRDKMDIIIHAAGYSSPQKFIQDPISSISINSTATINLFRNLKPDGKFLYISSDAIYSGCKDDVFTEESTGSVSLNDPRAGYIESKRVGEIITKKLGGNIARLSYAYGPGPKIDDGRVLNSFIVQALTTNKIILQDKGQAIRSWLYVSDAVQMMLNVLFYGTPGESYNIANVEHNNYTIYDLAKIISNLTGATLEINDSNGIVETSAPKAHTLSINKYEKQFGTKQFTNLHTGLERTLSWYQYLLGQPI